MISLTQLQNWVALGESETQEFKTTTSERTEASETLCGFLNRRGGRVIFGVDPQGRILGQDMSDKTLEDVAQTIKFIEPPVFPSFERVRIDERREVLVVTIERGDQFPYSFKNVSFQRVGATTQKLPREMVNQLLLERLHATQRWETEVAHSWTVEDLDRTEITRTLEEGIRRGRAEDPGTRDTLELLQGLGLLSRDGLLLRAAVVLFARSDRLLPDFPQCLLRVARFRGVNKSEFLDNKRFFGNAFDLLRRSERFLIDNLPIAGRIIPNLFEREDDPLYPTVALREALANAFCHRDYSEGGGSVGVAVFDDRLEITSSGELHFGLSPADLFLPHESRPWNPLVANVFYRRGIIETWGRGTLKIMDLVERAGLPKPEIEMGAGAVTVRFLPSRYVPPQRIQHDLTVHQRSILEVLANGNSVPLREIHIQIDAKLPIYRTRDDLAALKGWGMVDQSGWGRGSKWFLKRVET